MAVPHFDLRPTDLIFVYWLSSFELRPSDFGLPRPQPSSAPNLSPFVGLCHRFVTAMSPFVSQRTPYFNDVVTVSPIKHPLTHITHLPLAVLSGSSGSSCQFSVAGAGILDGMNEMYRMKAFGESCRGTDLDIPIKPPRSAPPPRPSLRTSRRFPHPVRTWTGRVRPYRFG